MLDNAEWIIPKETKGVLTPADWLFLTLGIYFHDVGLLVSRNEYEVRYQSAEYNRFLAEPIIPSSKYSEYLARLEQLSKEDADRIQYQDFVRANHGNRVQAWIEGVPLDDNEASKEVRQQISSLFSHVDATTRRDLALVCASHTRDDLSDTGKYKISQPYGSTRKEEVNLQYVAVVLRAADLLQITKRRAPLVLYQIVSPKDPISQLEWQKQGAVRSVRPKPGIDRDGNVSEAVASATVEVHARFERPDGFFGLTDYLLYAEQELQLCHAAIIKSERLLENPPKFPWRFIDSSGVEANGFLTQSFGFSLDQEKILELLTGHTLYNDTSVVIRELTQNALDAVRLQRFLDQKNNPLSTTAGHIKIAWRSKERMLMIIDNGTGMSQEVIEKHFLKVGSSRYQDEHFKEKYPEFSSISRFGIGALSVFMVSDDVEITTCSPDDPEARIISLRSVHGKYLIKLLNKVADREQIGVFPHGTSVRLNLRPTAEIGDVLKIAKMWLMFPQTRVTVHIDDEPPQDIGFCSPRDAIEGYLNGPAGRRRYDNKIEVREMEEDGVTLAFAVSKNEIFKEWSLFQIPQHRYAIDDEQEAPPTGIFIEGVGVEFSTPGFSAVNVLAIANAVGPAAPKTNVARSALEDTPEQRRMLATIYRLYSKHISNEIDRLATEEGYSLSRAVGEAPFIASLLLAQTNSLSRPSLLSKAISQTPLIIVEDGSGRRKISYEDLRALGEFWTVESPLSRSIETFVREAPSDITASSIIKTLGNSASTYPPGCTMCTFSSSSYVDAMVRADFEISEVSASESLRRINLKWSLKGERPRWIRSEDYWKRSAQSDRRLSSVLDWMHERGSRGATQQINLPTEKAPMAGLENVGGFASNGEVYIKVGEPIVEFFKDIVYGKDGVAKERCVASHLVLLQFAIGGGYDWAEFSKESLVRTEEYGIYEFLEPYISIDKFISALNRSNSRLFNPYAWDRRGKGL
ncbi:hypothetical protein CH341_16150 [Rhodoplanes roseus]|uniref:HD-CE domain-containing protein n=2 Tax=Rhodoplanes roseus TaxID=29409 RepID=A0A327L0Q3_9BRAD|nr:ATP-binding protein [Rhodoplanes roseus]RAI43092.1 hypothetical protein CH341_16150 [Rhodoplanes roseus]